MKNLTDALAVSVQSGVPVLLWGAPGVGKTRTIIAVADALQLHLEIVLASIREPSDFAGLPVVREAGVFMEPPAWAKRLAALGQGMLFLDEISTAAPAVQNALLRVVLERVVGDLALPAGVAVVAAANPPEMTASGWDLSAPLANRFCHLAWEVDIQAWVDGMLRGFPPPTIPILPSTWQASIPMMRILVATFIRHRPNLLLDFPKSEERAGKAWPSPRSWDTVATLLAAAGTAQVGDEPILMLIKGCVGEGAALEFFAWRRSFDLPDPEALLEAPHSFKVLARGDQTLAALSAVVQAAISNLTVNRWMAAWAVLACAADQGARDVAAVAAKALATARKPGLPLPQRELKQFLPLLQKSGLIDEVL